MSGLDLDTADSKRAILAIGVVCIDDTLRLAIWPLTVEL